MKSMESAYLNGVSILELFAGKDKALLVRRDALLIPDLSLDILGCIEGLDLKGDCLAGQCLHENLHATIE